MPLGELFQPLIDIHPVGLSRGCWPPTDLD
jgi:hypothetical protein